MLGTQPRRAGPVELARREQGAIEVALFWDSATSRVTVVLWNWISGACLHMNVEPHEANYAFTHPYGYAAQHGIPPQDIRQAA
jgi:hypothetical protein